MQWHDRRARFASVMVTSTRRGGGVLDLPFELDVERTMRTGEVAYER